jgi:hypothetical protein
VEVLLARSSLKGAVTRVSTDRQYLRRALRLGFTELQVTKADAPVCCRDRSRCYLWVPLDPATTMPADADVQRITAADVTAAPDTPTPSRRTLPMPTSSANGDAANGANHRDKNPPAEAPTPGGLADVILEAEALRDALHGALPDRPLLIGRGSWHRCDRHRRHARRRPVDVGRRRPSCVGPEPRRPGLHAQLRSGRDHARIHLTIPRVNDC